MPIVIGLNPVKKRKKKKLSKKMISKKSKGKVKTMAKKKNSTTKKPSIRYRVKEKIKYKYRSKPGKKKSAPYKIRRKDNNELDLKKIVIASFSVSAGMIVAKAAVNKLTEGGSEQIRWTWPNIATAAASSMIAAFALGAIFRLKRPTVALIATGGVALAGYKAFTCKLAPKWGWTESWFGADEDIEINPEFLGMDEAPEQFEVVDYEQPMMTGATESGGQVVPYNPAFGATQSGGQVVPFNPAMGMTNMELVAAPYPGSY